MKKRKKIESFLEQIDQKVGETSALQKVRILVDFAYERLFYKTRYFDYLKYRFFEKNRMGRDQFVTERRKMQFTRTCNSAEGNKVFSNKALFAEKFRDYLKRDFLDMEKAGREEFIDFAIKHGRLFVKPTKGFFGLGAYIAECHSREEAEKLYDELCGKTLLVEQVIKQHETMAAFNETSVNTLRIVTFVRADGTPEIMPGALIRIGRKGGCADNFHHGGIGAIIDIETGIVYTMGINKHGDRFVKHPDSGLPIVGFEIPYWNEVCEFAKKAALVCPSVRYVGWDVSINEKGEFLLIEGNCWADPDLAQMGDGVGKWPVYRSLMEEVQKLKK